MKTIHNGIPVWGEPDQGAIAQMTNCAKHDDVVGAVLMADHHLDYADLGNLLI